MEFGLELAKGATERVLGVKLPIFMRIVLPGLALSAVLYPSVIWLLRHLPSDEDHWWQRILGYIILLLFFGASVSTLNGEIYKLFEGRSLWPKAFVEWGRKRQQARVEKLMADSKKATSPVDYDEIWYKLRSYPLNKTGDPEATHPTRLGNILAAYERYPENRYGMDSIFFWTRIWLQMDADKKADIDGDWCLADGFLTLSAISLFGGTLWFLQATVAIGSLGWKLLPFGSALGASLGALVWYLLSLFFYRLSLPYHLANGEIYKAIFDVYREKAWSLASLKPQEQETWRAAWAYLQYALLRCPNCKEGYNTVEADKCCKCAFGLAEYNNAFRNDGKFRI